MRTQQAAIAIFLLCLLTFSCKKDQLQLQQVVQLDSHTQSRLNRILFVNDHTCIIGAGERFAKAELLRSTDTAYTWALDSFPSVGKGLYGLGQSPTGNIFLSGLDGKAVRSSDLGNSWQQLQIADWRYYVGISFPESNKGFCIATVGQGEGHITHVDSNLVIYHTSDYNFGLNDIMFTDIQTGYVSGFGVILKTTDGGNNWRYLDIKGDNFKALSVVGNNLWTCGSAGSIFHSADSGAHWEQLRNADDLSLPRYWLNGIVFKDYANGWAVGENGLLLYTDDGGNHWMEYEHFTSSSLNCISLCPNGDLLVGGDNGALFRLKL